jgi:hypothetical protein
MLLTGKRLTLDEFRRWLVDHDAHVVVRPYTIVVCSCGDVNCHGWRLVAEATQP